MVEVPSISEKENLSFKEKLSWRDIQGLSWTFEKHSFELNDNSHTYAQA